MPKKAKSKSKSGGGERISSAIRKVAKASNHESRKPTEIAIGGPKGRPMLVWVGKRPLGRVRTFPAQLIEVFDPAGAQGPGAKNPAIWKDWPDHVAKAGLFFHGDNKDILGHLLGNGFRGKVNLVYIDPPFDSGADYVRKVTLRGPKGTVKIDGEGYSLGEQIQYTDIWANDNYLQFMYERLQLLKELLTPGGFIFLHCNLERSSHLRCILDEILGPAAFKNEIVWKRREAHADTHGVGNVHDVLLVYGADPNANLETLYVPYDEDYIKSHYTLQDPDGRKYSLGDCTAPGPRPGLHYEFHAVWPPPGRVWFTVKDKMEALFQQGRIVLTSEGKPRRKQYLDESEGMPVHDMWADVFAINSQAAEALGYPTQKPEDLLRRVLNLASKPGDLVLDCFAGSGTTAAVAQRLGRRWICCDLNKGAIQTASRRLQSVIREQVETQQAPKQHLLPGAEDKNAPPDPAQLSFGVWRVNDYDLAVQHNEAVNLACESIGVQRSRSDGFFDGVLGRTLVKVVPFGHPLSPVDLEEVKRELASRPDEDRAVTVVTLGVEVSAREWVDEWNRLRKGKETANRIEIIDLRTDPVHGGFIKHEPAIARVIMERKKDEISVEIQDFISPSILSRLQLQHGVLKPKVDDFKTMIESVAIDTSYDGRVFKLAYSDVPERKTELIAAKYRLKAPKGRSTVAVKITDMLGEEVLVTKELD